jgi:uncharacterized protein (DUF3084 family)
MADNVQGEEQIVTAAEQLIELGRLQSFLQAYLQGFLQGFLQGRREVLLRQLKIRFGDLPQTAVTRVNSAGNNDIDRWAMRILTDAALEDVLEMT